MAERQLAQTDSIRLGHFDGTTETFGSRRAQGDYRLLHMNEGLTLVVRNESLRSTMSQIIEEGWDGLIDIEAQCDDEAQRVLLVDRLTSRVRAHARLEVQTMIDAGASWPTVKDMFPEAGALEAAILPPKVVFF